MAFNQGAGPSQPNNGLPRGLPSQHKKEIKNLTREELVELIKKCEKVLSQRALLQRLPDKGQKVQESLMKAQMELDLREKREQNAFLLESSNLVQEFEWKLHIDTHSHRTNTGSTFNKPSTSSTSSNIDIAANSTSATPATSGIAPVVDPMNPFRVGREPRHKVVQDLRPQQYVPMLLRINQNMVKPHGGVKLLTLEESAALQQRGKEGGSSNVAVVVAEPTQETSVGSTSVLPPSVGAPPKYRDALPQKPAKFSPYRQNQDDTDTSSDEEDAENLERISEESEAE